MELSSSSSSRDDTNRNRHFSLPPPPPSSSLNDNSHRLLSVRLSESFIHRQLVKNRQEIQYKIKERETNKFANPLASRSPSLSSPSLSPTPSPSASAHSLSSSYLSSLLHSSLSALQCTQNEQNKQIIQRRIQRENPKEKSKTKGKMNSNRNKNINSHSQSLRDTHRIPIHSDTHSQISSSPQISLEYFHSMGMSMAKKLSSPSECPSFSSPIPNDYHLDSHSNDNFISVYGRNNYESSHPNDRNVCASPPLSHPSLVQRYPLSSSSSSSSFPLSATSSSSMLSSPSFPPSPSVLSSSSSRVVQNRRHLRPSPSPSPSSSSSPSPSFVPSKRSFSSPKVSLSSPPSSVPLNPHFSRLQTVKISAQNSLLRNFILREKRKNKNMGNTGGKYKDNEKDEGNDKERKHEETQRHQQQKIQKNQKHFPPNDMNDINQNPPVNMTNIHIHKNKTEISPLSQSNFPSIRDSEESMMEHLKTSGNPITISGNEEDEDDVPSSVLSPPVRLIPHVEWEIKHLEKTKLFIDKSIKNQMGQTVNTQNYDINNSDDDVVVPNNNFTSVHPIEKTSEESPSDDSNDEESQDENPNANNKNTLENHERQLDSHDNPISVPFPSSSFLLLSNFPPSLTIEEIRTLCSTVGKLTEFPLEITKSKDLNHPQCVVEFEDPVQCEEAEYVFNGFQVEGFTIRAERTMITVDIMPVDIDSDMRIGNGNGNNGIEREGENEIQTETESRKQIPTDSDHFQNKGIHNITLRTQHHQSNIDNEIEIPYISVKPSEVKKNPTGNKIQIIKMQNFPLNHSTSPSPSPSSPFRFPSKSKPKVKRNHPTLMSSPLPLSNGNPILLSDENVRNAFLSLSQKHSDHSPPPPIPLPLNSHEVVESYWKAFANVKGNDEGKDSGNGQ